ncbi:HisA/HisF family protein [Methanobrevibacter filiformis]|uniref:Phosphoribosyl isomerase A n=1 Tax=Methanobrevibacter filiformis TaxID=55758 RepID=A0A166AZF9_9EURY|nr:HisA/HisF family protein [Methanobrevibacter filiformis]KZX12668.1 phosphoribosyl isomerase A [Methanobrevibacter filiformis]
MVKIIPVMDLMNGMAVSGKSGNRSTYSQLKTIFSPDSNPIAISNSLKLTGADEIYIADLDLIEKQGNNLDKIKMINTFVPVMLDCGISTFKSFKFFLDFAYKIIVATETLESIDELYKIFDKIGRQRIVVSVDIKDNELYSNSLDIDLNEFKNVLHDINPDEIILLDISRVGTEKGINTKLINEFSEFKENIILGGGIANDNISEMDKLGIKKALVGSAIHNGEIDLSSNLY